MGETKKVLGWMDIIRHICIGFATPKETTHIPGVENVDVHTHLPRNSPNCTKNLIPQLPVTFHSEVTGHAHGRYPKTYSSRHAVAFAIPIAAANEFIRICATQQQRRANRSLGETNKDKSAHHKL